MLLNGYTDTVSFSFIILVQTVYKQLTSNRITVILNNLFTFDCFSTIILCLLYIENIYLDISISSNMNTADGCTFSPLVVYCSLYSVITIRLSYYYGIAYWL